MIGEAAVQTRGGGSLSRALIGGVADQGVLEGVVGLGRRAAAEDQLGGSRDLSRAPSSASGDRSAIAVRAAWSNSRPMTAAIWATSLTSGDAVEAGHERIVQGRRHSGVAGLEDGLGQLLDKQRHAVGAGDDGVDDLDGQDGAAAQPVDDRLDAGAAEAVEGEAGDVRVAGERRLVLGPAGQQQQDGCRGAAIERLLDELERGRVDPVRVLEHEQHRLLAGEAEDLVDQRPERAGPLRLRASARCLP